MTRHKPLVVCWCRWEFCRATQSKMAVWAAATSALPSRNGNTNGVINASDKGLVKSRSVQACLPKCGLCGQGESRTGTGYSRVARIESGVKRTMR